MVKRKRAKKRSKRRGQRVKKRGKKGIDKEEGRNMNEGKII